MIIKWYVWDARDDRSSATEILSEDTDDHKDIAMFWANLAEDDFKSCNVFVVKGNETEAMGFKVQAHWVRTFEISESNNTE